MKNLVYTCLLLISISFAVSAQHKPESVSFKKKAKEKSKKMHAEYPKVSEVKFKDCKNVEEQHKKVDEAWHKLWHDFTEYYHDKGLYFKNKKRLFVHLHFSETGHLDYFGYRFRRVKDEKAERFVKLFHEFIENYDIGLNEGVKFSQCGELHLLPRKGVKEGM